jgi:hypothetical protein
VALNDRSLGDMAKVMAALPQHRWEEAAELLGFALPPTTTPVAASFTTTWNVEAPTSGTEQLAATSVGTAPAGTMTTEDDLPVRQPSRVAAPAREIPWLAGVTSLPRTAGPAIATVADDALLPARTANAVLGAAVATLGPSRWVDVDALVRGIAGRRLGRTLPRLNRRTLARGAQVLVDVGEALEPFATDRGDLVERLRRVMGVNLEEGWFVNSPEDGVGIGFGGPMRYDPPAPGTPVLLVTDLGVGGPVLRPRRPRSQVWAQFAQALRRRDSPVVAFVPYPPDRWPAGSARPLAVVEWDRTTTLTTVRAARRATGDRA